MFQSSCLGGSQVTQLNLFMPIIPDLLNQVSLILYTGMQLNVMVGCACCFPKFDNMWTAVWAEEAYLPNQTFPKNLTLCDLPSVKIFCYAIGDFIFLSSGLQTVCMSCSCLPYLLPNKWRLRKWSWKHQGHTVKSWCCQPTMVQRICGCWQHITILKSAGFTRSISSMD